MHEHLMNHSRKTAYRRIEPRRRSVYVCLKTLISVFSSSSQHVNSGIDMSKSPKIDGICISTSFSISIHFDFRGVKG